MTFHYYQRQLGCLTFIINLYLGTAYNMYGFPQIAHCFTPLLSRLLQGQKF